MSDDAQNSLGGSNSNSMLNHLLAMATEAQGDRPTDLTLPQMSLEDRLWLENALEHISTDSDPVKKLKRWMQRLCQIEHPTENNLIDIKDILEEIDDMVCDMDLSQIFCTLGGIALIKRFISEDFDPASALFINLLAVLAQYNPKVQQKLLKEIFLEHCLTVITDENRSMDYKHKCVGAISAMVKGFSPGLIRFIQLEGPEKVMQCFDASLQSGETKLVHRCAVAAVTLKNSFSTEVININQNFRKMAEWPVQMKKKIEEKSDDELFELKYRETLEFLS